MSFFSVATDFISFVFTADGDVRLVNGQTFHEGRLEVYMNGEWGTVCDDEWTIQNAQVVCRQLGFGSAQTFQVFSFFGAGRGSILMDDVVCSGSEIRLMDCQFQTEHNCDQINHDEDVGIVCEMPGRIKFQ